MAPPNPGPTSGPASDDEIPGLVDFTPIDQAPRRTAPPGQAPMSMSDIDRSASNPDGPPSEATMAGLRDAIAEFLRALEQHPQGKSASVPSPSIYWVHSFMGQTHAMVVEVLSRSREELLANEKTIVPPGEQEKVTPLQMWNEAVGRCIWGELLVTDTSGKTAAMCEGDPTKILDFGDEIRAKGKAARDACNRT